MQRLSATDHHLQKIIAKREKISKQILANFERKAKRQKKGRRVPAINILPGQTILDNPSQSAFNSPSQSIFKNPSQSTFKNSSQSVG